MKLLTTVAKATGDFLGDGARWSVTCRTGNPFYTSFAWFQTRAEARTYARKARKSWNAANTPWPK